MRPLIVGSRGSPLALTQTRMVVTDLKTKWPGQNFEIRVLKTQGDSLTEAGRPPGEALGSGIFTNELEKALLDKKIDLAVHSLKDMPTAETAGLMLAAIPKRADARDVLITRGPNLGIELPDGAVIATGSPRRAAQLHLVRHDFRTAEIRGNIDSRLKKFRENLEWNGTLLAMAGLERLRPDVEGLSLTLLPFSQMLPAPGQGALAVQTRKEGSTDIINLLYAIHHQETAAAVTAERMFLEALGGGCREPIAAYAEVLPDKKLRLEGLAWLLGDDRPRRGKMTKRMDQAEALGIELAVEISR